MKIKHNQTKYMMVNECLYIVIHEHSEYNHILIISSVGYVSTNISFCMQLTMLAMSGMVLA